MSQTLQGEHRPVPPGRQMRAPGSNHPPRDFAVLVLAQVALLSALTHRSWFFADDFYFLAVGRETGLSLHYLRLPLFEHFSPVHRLLDFAFVRTFGLSWPAAHVVLLILAGACISMFALVASALLSSRRWAFVLTAVYGASLSFVRNVAWWTGGTHLLLLTLFTLVTILGYVRWREEDGHRWAAVSLAAYALALLTHEQAMLVPVYLGLLRILLLGRCRRGWLLVEWPLWGGYAALTLLCAANFVAGYYHPHVSPAPSDVARFLAVSFFQGLLPAVVAVKVPEAMVVSVGVSVVLAALVAAGVVLASLWRSSAAWRSWAFFAGSFVVAVLPLGMARIAIDGVTVGRELRYLMAPSFLVLVALGAAFDSRYAPVARRTPRAPHRPRNRTAKLAPVLAALYLVLLIRDAGKLQRSLWEPVQPKRYFSTFRQDYSRLRAEGKEPVIIPGRVPEGVVPGWLFPYNTYEHALVLAEPGVRFEGPGPRYAVDAEGSIHPEQAER